MLGTRVPFFAHFGQIPLSIITLFSCGLSFWLTVRFCASLAPGHAAVELLAMGVTWELAKLTFGTLGSHRIKRSNAGDRVAGYALLGVSLVLAVGSIVASLAFLMQTDQHVSQDALYASQQALHASEAYERETATLHALDGEIKELVSLAQQYRERGLLTQGMRSMERATALRQERQAQAQALSEQEEVAIATHGAARGGAALPGASPAGRLVAQVVLAVMLEVVSMIALSLLSGSGTKPAVGGSASSDAPDAKVVRLKVASPRITSDASLHRSASGAAHRDTDANAHRTLLHRMKADAASPRITCDASLHRPASGGAMRGPDANRAPAGSYDMRTDAASLCMTNDAEVSHPASRQTGFDAAFAFASPPISHRRRRDAQRLRTLYAQAKELVRTAQLRPCYREMQRGLGASQHVVQRFLRNLVAEGVLCRRGTGYALVAPLSAHGGAA